MQPYVPEVAWHDKEAILSIDVHKKISDRLVSSESLKTASLTEAGESSQLTTPEVYKMVTGSMQKEVRIWEFFFDPPIGTQGTAERPFLSVDFIANLTGHHRAIDVVRFSHNGLLLASGDADGAILIWKVKPSEPDMSPSKADIERSLDRCDDLPPNRENWIRALNSPLRHDKEVTDLAWSPDSSLLASVSMDDSVLLHRVDTGKRVWSVRSFRRFPNGIVWDPRGKYLVTMSTDRRFDVLDAAKGTRLRCCHKVDLPDTLLSSGINLIKETYKIFHDDQLSSFTRAVEFSPCGSIIFAPAAHLEVGESNVYGTCIFKRADLDLCRPSAILVSKNPTFAIKCSPVCYELREDVKENFLGLPYRAVFAVLSKRAIFFYDSQYSKPFSYIDNVFCGDMTSLAWTPDGKVLVVSSLEGFNCFITIDATELGVKCAEQPPLSRIQQLVKREIADGEQEAKTEIVYPDSPKIAPVRKTPRIRKDPLSQVKKESTPTTNMETDAAPVQSNNESSGGTPIRPKKETSKLTPTHSNREPKASTPTHIKKDKEAAEEKTTAKVPTVVQRRINQFW